MQPNHPWLQKCLQKLEELPQIETTTTIEPFVENTIADGLLTIYTPHNKFKYIFEIKSPIALETIDSTTNYLNYEKRKSSNDQRTLLITDALSETVVNFLLEKNIEFIDTTGNIYLNNSSLYILIRSSSTQTKKLPSTSTITNSTLKVAYAILQDPIILEYPTSELIANAAGVDWKTVESSLENLYQLNYLQRQRNEKYRIKSYTKLLEIWELGYIENLRSELLIGTFSSKENIDFNDISNQVLAITQNQKIIIGRKIIIGGELGAAIVTGYLKPISMIIHIPEEENYRVITTMLRLKPDPKGNISIFKQFGNKNKHKYPSSEPVADPLLIHAELYLHPDERLKETAKHLYEKYIIFYQEISEMI